MGSNRRSHRRRHAGVVVVTGVVYLRLAYLGLTYLRFPQQRFPQLGLPRHVRGSPAAIPEIEEEDQPGRAGGHEDPADGVEVQPGEFPVHRERQDRAQREEEDAYTNTHGRPFAQPPRS